MSVLSYNKYYVGFPGCTLFFYETDGRSGIDNNSIPKHAIWVENSIVQAVPEHPKKDFVFCLSNSLGDAFLFQVGECLNVIWSVNNCKILHGQALPWPICTLVFSPLMIF